MPTIKKKGRSLAPKKKSPANNLASRVKQLEEDMQEMRAKMDDLGDDLSALRTTVKHVDERTLRGEGVMMSMQGEQRRMSKVLDLVAEKLNVVPLAQLTPASEPTVEEVEDGDLEPEETT